MLDGLMSLIAPHHCSGCGIRGTLLCDNCKYDILEDTFVGCASCGKRLAGKSGICARCRVPYARAWCVAERRDTLQRLIGNFKFTYTRSAYKPLAELLHEHLPELPRNTVIVPVPTAHSHIRERGYDHMLLVARQLSRLRDRPLENKLLCRATNTKQRSESARKRTKQARVAFETTRPADPSAIYLLIDDVITTGATVKYASKALLDAGAKEVWVASISRQPLDQQG